MFYGEYTHNLDNKGRIIIPAKFREKLTDRFIITKGLDKCLVIYTFEEWAVLENKIKQLPMTNPDVRRFSRFFFGGAFEAEADAQGRVGIPANLREYAGITKELVTSGLSNRIEIWSKESWDNYNDEDNYVDTELQKKMAEYGV